MNNPFFVKMQKIIAARRPGWTYTIEDTCVRVNTMQFAVNWSIITEIIETKDYKVNEVIMHQALGTVITIEYIGGQ